MTHPSPKRNKVPEAALMRAGLVSLTTARPVNTAQPRTTVNSARPMTNVFNKAHSTFKRPINNKIATKNSNFNKRVNTVSGKNVNNARPKAVVNTAKPKAVLNVVKGNQVNAVKASASVDHSLSKSKISPDDGFKPLGDDEKKVTEEPGKKGSDSSKDSKSNNQKEEDSVNSTNTVNAASTNEVNDVGAKTSIKLPNDPNMPELEDIVYSDDDKRVYKVEKTLYGLHQAPRDWYETLATYLLDNGFQRGKIDKTLFIRMDKVKQKEDEIFISQDKYVTEILKKFGFTDVKTASYTLGKLKSLDSRIKLREGPPITPHNVDVINIVLKGQPKLGLWYLKDSPFDFVAYTNSDYAGGKPWIGVNNRRLSIFYVSARSRLWLLTQQQRDSNEKKLIQMIKIHNDNNVADLLTKAFDVKTINGEVQLQALVDRKKIVITESTLSLMRYEKLSQKLTFYKAFFSPQWKFHIHTILQCLSAKTTAWNEFSSTMASTIICLATNQKFNFSKYIFKSMVKNLDNAGKFLMYLRFVQVFLDNQLEEMETHSRTYIAPSHTKKIFANMKRQGKDFSSRVTPLFSTMVVQAQEEIGEDSAMPTNPHHTPIITQPSSSQPQKKQKSRRPKRKDTEVPQPSDPTNAADEDVNELGSTRVISSDEASLGDQEDASKQGRKIDDIDADEGIIFDITDKAGEKRNIVEEAVAVTDAVTIPVSAATITNVDITT
ncbi:putative ribonuclease H-like domain-containing protein [Tanacetum coccineum]|uniref:Ribonuclease H-like domain-containing protein n=1 Tax=Tanacetum coccineum TaxID=301880 RepID=A0ABQ5B4K2_9ASTR